MTITSSDFPRHAFGLEVRETLIFERTLELSKKLCWNSEDLGIARVRIHDGKRFSSKAELTRYCKEHHQSLPTQDDYYFDWLDPLKKPTGRARAKMLHHYWCNREQVFNILFDTAMQAYSDEGRTLLSSITGVDLRNADLVKFKTSKHASPYTGDPDSVFIDLHSKRIVLVEIKIGGSAATTKYSFEQSVKYETLAALLRSESFFPGFHVHKILIAPESSFSDNTLDADHLGFSCDTEGNVLFSYDAKALAKIKPTGCRDFGELIPRRLQELSKGGIDPESIENLDKPGVIFFSWNDIVERCSPGLL